MLLAYLKRHYKIIILIGAFIGVFAAVFSLYDLPVEAVAYAALLCAVVGAILFALGYSRYMHRHRELLRLRRVVVNDLDHLPQPSGVLEQDYQDLLRLLREQTRAVESRAAIERRDMVDYYTLWAHQIKTPIAAMRLLLQSEEHPDSAALQGELLQIERYVEMVLSYLRLDSESSDLLLLPRRVDDIARQAARKYARLFILKKLPLDFRVEELTVITDEKWLLFVVEQLLANAVKYTRQGGVSIYLEREGEDISLVVADTGIGIRAEDLPRVFEKGFTGYNGREDKKSTGLGLYLCKRTCDMLGHGLVLESKPGQGTRARIVFHRQEQVIE